jgi:hypothetical protein
MKQALPGNTSKPHQRMSLGSKNKIFTRKSNRKADKYSSFYIMNIPQNIIFAVSFVLTQQQVTGEREIANE